MPTFLFWNVNRNRAAVEDRIARLARAHAVDVLILAEYPPDPAGLVERLRTETAAPFRRVSPLRSDIRVLACQPDLEWTPRVNRPRYQFYRVRRTTAPPGPPIIVGVAHLTSKQYGRTPDTLRLLTRPLVRALAAEEQHENAGALLVGDLNMNPFEPGVAGADALHAVSTRAKASEGVRRIGGDEYPMFYNPMWGLFGDRDPTRPPGTYYRSAAEEVCHFWNVYDQVLLRPALMDRLARVTILGTDGVQTLLTPAGLPDARTASDHLPLLFTLDL